jgi:spore germination protein KC
MRTCDIFGTIIIFLIFIFCFFQIEGFTNPLGNLVHEIEENNFVGVIGIDTEDSGSKLKVSVVFPSMETPNANGKNEKNKHNTILTAEGKTIFEAHRNLYLLSAKKLNYGHTGWIILSENTARQNLANNLDFELRDFERGSNLKIAIVKGTTAEHFLSVASKQNNPLDKLITGMRNASDTLSISAQVTLPDIFVYLRQSESFCMPYFELSTSNNDKNEVTNKPIMSGGLAVIKDRKLYDFLSKELSRSTNWISGNIKSASIVVKSPNNNNCSLEVLSSHSRITIDFIGKIPKANITIVIKSQINELPAIESTPMDDLIKELKKAQENYVLYEANNALKYSQENGVDVLDIGKTVYHQYPLKWKSIKSTWNNIYPKIKTSLYVDSNINSSRMMKNYMIESRKKE